MIFTVQRGAHYCSPRKIRAYNGTSAMHGRFMLHDNMWYDTSKVGTHINKLVGFSTDLFSDGSIRLGWRPNIEPGIIDIYAYLHINGKWVRSGRLVNDLIQSCYPKVWYDFAILPDIREEDDLCRLVVGGGIVERHYPMSLGTGWFQQLYYGGTPTAPWTVSCDIEVEGIV